jgi:hypothetical protein
MGRRWGFGAPTTAPQSVTACWWVVGVVTGHEAINNDFNPFYPIRWPLCGCACGTVFRMIPRISDSSSRHLPDGPCNPYVFLILLVSLQGLGRSGGLEG